MHLLLPLAVRIQSLAEIEPNISGAVGRIFAVAIAFQVIPKALNRSVGKLLGLLICDDEARASLMRIVEQGGA